MKVKWTSLVDDVRGHIDSRHYARHIPGNGSEAAICQKPELSKKEKKKRAAHPTSKRFCSYIAESKAILHDPERRVAWQAKYEETLYRAKKWGEASLRTIVRLCSPRSERGHQARRRGKAVKSMADERIAL